MRLKGYYSSGQFAKLASVSVRTIRFYDTQNILKPSMVNDNGARFYTDEDLKKLQQILLLKYLGFSLEDIRQILVTDTDSRQLKNSLALQLRLVRDRIEQMQLVEDAIVRTGEELENGGDISWSHLLELIHLTNMEKSLAAQYRDASNLSARINLHSRYSTGKEDWFKWIFRQLDLEEGSSVLEIGCGDGTLWTRNLALLPDKIRICLSDVSDGMIRDVRRTITESYSSARKGESSQGKDIFSFRTFDCAEIPFEAGSFDLVIANHVLFYCEDIPAVLREVRRVLKKEGRFICSCYGAAHMHEITDLVQEFDSRITLSAERLYERFGLENGARILSEVFRDTEMRRFEDSLLVDQAQPLADYILSCHGNQNQFLCDRYREFLTFVEGKVKRGFPITKDAGIFICRL